MVEDHKLKAVNPDQLQTVAYGSQEDDASALDTLSEIAVSTEHSRGTLVYQIVKSLEKMCNVSRFLSLASPLNRYKSTVITTVNYFQSEMEKMREQLLTEFMPDDACPLGTRVLEDTQKPFQASFGDVKPQNVLALLFTITL